MTDRGGSGRRASRVAATARRIGTALALLALAGCASAGDWRDGRFAPARLGGSIGDIAALEPGWQREKSEDATLAFRHADGSRASWLRECRAVAVNPKALGRALWITLPGGVIEENSAREIAGAAAWQFSGRAQDGALGLRLATITRVAPRCEDSWMLVVPHAEFHHRDAFEQWARGFAEEGPTR